MADHTWQWIKVAALADVPWGEAKAVSIHHSKTPAEYAREARVDATGKMTLGGLVSTLYLHLFGGAPIDERGYRDFVANTELVLPHVGSR